jgi:hypothetical protein
MIASPTKGRITDPRVVNHACHTWQNTSGAAVIWYIAGITQSGLADVAYHGHFDKLLFVGC